MISGEPGEEVILHAGDATCTRENEAHFLRNETDQPVEFLAVILGTGTVEII